MTDTTAGPAPAPKPPHGGACCHTEGATGTSKQGTAMVCQPAKDGRLRWHRSGPKTGGGGKTKTSHGYAGAALPQVNAVTLAPASVSVQAHHPVSTFADADAQAVILTCPCGQTGMVPFIGWGPAGAQRQADADADSHHRNPHTFALRDHDAAAPDGQIDPVALSGELNAAHRRHMETTAMADSLDEAVRAYMESGDTSAAADADRVARQYRRGQLTADDVNDAMERIAERSAAEAPKLSGEYNTDVEQIPNNGVSLNPPPGAVSYHEDSYLADALRNMGNQGRHLDVDGDTLANKVGKISGDSIAGRITPQQEIDELRRLRSRIPNGHPAQTALSTAIANMDAPYIPVPDIPKGTPAPLRKLVEQLHEIPLARQTRVSDHSVDPDPSEVQLVGDILDGYHSGEIPPSELISSVRVLARRRHEIYAGKVQLDRAVDQAAEALKQMVETRHPVFEGRR